MKLIAISKRCTSAAFLAALIAASSPVALAKTYLGSGGTSCAEYMAIKQALPDTGKAIDLWLLGYVSGLNFYAYANKKSIFSLISLRRMLLASFRGTAQSTEARH